MDDTRRPRHGALETCGRTMRKVLVQIIHVTIVTAIWAIGYDTMVVSTGRQRTPEERRRDRQSTKLYKAELAAKEKLAQRRPFPRLDKLEHATGARLDLERDCNVENMNKCCTQYQSPLFRKLPTEIRMAIFAQVWTPADHGLYPDEWTFLTPGYKVRPTIHTAALLTCRRIWLECNHLPQMLNPHCFWLDRTWSPHPSRVLDWTPNFTVEHERYRLFCVDRVIRKQAAKTRTLHVYLKGTGYEDPRDAFDAATNVREPGGYGNPLANGLILHELRITLDATTFGRHHDAVDPTHVPGNVHGLRGTLRQAFAQGLWAKCSIRIVAQQCDAMKFDGICQLLRGTSEGLKHVRCTPSEPQWNESGTLNEEEIALIQAQMDAIEANPFNNYTTHGVELSPADAWQIYQRLDRRLVELEQDRTQRSVVFFVQWDIDQSQVLTTEDVNKEALSVCTPRRKFWFPGRVEQNISEIRARWDREQSLLTLES